MRPDAGQYGSAGAAASFPLGLYGTARTADRYTQRFAVSYVTESHAFKVGFNVDEGTSADNVQVNGDRAYRFAGSADPSRPLPAGAQYAVPNQITLFATPWSEEERMRPNLGIFAQDRWTMNRLTLNLGLRFEYLRYMFRWCPLVSPPPLEETWSETQ